MVESVLQVLLNPWVMYPLLFWSIFWKGMALWRSARLNHKIWFVVLLIINTMGIFEIIYIIATRKRYRFTEGFLR